MLGFVAPSFALLIVTSPALAERRSDLPSRLPQAYETYRKHLEKEGRADELTMSAEQKLEALEGWYSPPDSAGTRIELRWFGPRDSTWTQVERVVKAPLSALIGPYPGRLFGEDLDPNLPPRDSNEDCQNSVSGAFQVASNESVLFTVGHFMESCTETPLMVVRARSKEFKYVLPDLFGYNTQGLWYTGTYLILNIKVEYEYGAIFEGLAFWNLEKGWIHSAVTETHVGVSWGDEPPRADPTEGLGVFLRDLRYARLGESNGHVLVDHGSVKLAFWPAKQEWMLVP